MTTDLFYPLDVLGNLSHLGAMPENHDFDDHHYDDHGLTLIMIMICNLSQHGAMPAESILFCAKYLSIDLGNF